MKIKPFRFGDAKNANNFTPAKTIFETVSCANCLIFIDFTIKSTRLLTGLALAMSLSDALAAGRGRREQVHMGSNTARAGVPSSGESCSAEMHLLRLVVIGKALQGWGGTVVSLCQVSCIFSRALVWSLVPLASRGLLTG